MPAPCCRSLGNGRCLPGCGFLERLGQLTAEISDQLAQGGDGATRLSRQGPPPDTNASGAGLQQLFAAL